MSFVDLNLLKNEAKILKKQPVLCSKCTKLIQSNGYEKKRSHFFVTMFASFNT